MTFTLGFILGWFFGGFVTLTLLALYATFRSGDLQ